MSPSAAARVILSNAYKWSPLAIADLIFYNSYKTCIATGAFSHDKTSASTRSIDTVAPDWRVLLNSSYYGNTPTRYEGFDGATVTLSGYANAGNNGSFTAYSPNTGEIRFVNAAGVIETLGVGIGNAVVSSPGYCMNYTDLKYGIAFTSGDVNRNYGVATHLIPGSVKVLGTAGAGGRYMGATSGVTSAAQLNGTGPFTCWKYFRPTTMNYSGNTSYWMTIGGPTSAIDVYYGNATTMTLSIKDAAAASTIHTATVSPGLVLNAWQLLAVTYSAGLAAFHINGTQVGSISGAPIRTRAGFDRVYFGQGAGTFGHQAIDGACAHVMSASEQAQLLAYCRAEYV
jgi:hypothetical protein